MTENDETEYKMYLGDAVYASYDGYHIWLRTEDGNDQHIALEPDVFNNLVIFAHKVMAYRHKAD